MSDGTKETTVIEAEPARPVGSSASTPRSDRARQSSYRARFGLVYFLLALVAGVAVGGFLVALTRPDPAPPVPWSPGFVPEGSEAAKAKQIAARISERYKLANGQQLAAALVGPPEVSAGASQGGNIPVRAIAIRPDTSTGKQEENDIQIIDASGSLVFVLCGLGQNCSIKGGTPSEARHAMLRREALELALYTFKYVKDVNAVTVFLPPRPDGAAAGTSVFLQKRNVKDELAKPLAKTIQPVVPAIGKMTKAELAAVDRITEPRLYTYEYQQAQDGSAVLVLDPVILGA